jgi:acyl transferase domain-containing protein
MPALTVLPRFAMGRELFHTYPIFQQSVLRGAKHLKELGAEWSLIEELSKDAKSSRINEASISQPCCTAIQIALTDLLKSWGIRPSAVAGHSSGEIAAAYAARVLSLADAMTISHFRGKFAGTIEPGKGGMAAVTASESDTDAMISGLKQGQATIACFNSPNSMTVSGDVAAIEELLQVCKTRDIFARKLVVDVAYHSSHMTEVADQYREAIKHIQPQVAEAVPFYSSVTGEIIDSPKTLGSEYWIQNLVSPVRFSEALSTMFMTKATTRRLGASRKTPNVIVELGPHSALAGPIKQTLSTQKYSYFSALVRNKDAVETAMSLAARLYETGHSTLNFAEINGTSAKRQGSLLVDLPRYPFNHSVSYWAESRESIQYRLRKWPRHDLLGAPVRMPNSLEPRWRNWIRTSELPWVRDHKVQGLVIYPAAGYLAMAIEAAYQKATSANTAAVTGYELREITIGQAMIIPEESGEVESMLSLRPYADSSRTTSEIWDEFRISSAGDDGTWTEHCRGLISVKLKQPSSEVHNSVKEDEDFYAKERELIFESCAEQVDVAQVNLPRLSMGSADRGRCTRNAPMLDSTVRH